jgi:hypothetical protein
MQRDIHHTVPGKYGWKKEEASHSPGPRCGRELEEKRETLGGLIKNSWPESENKTNRKEKKHSAVLR